MSLSENEKSQIRDKVFNEINPGDLKTDNGVEPLIAFSDSVFKKDELAEIYEYYVNFDRYRKDSSDIMENYILEFEKLYNKTKKFKMELPESVLAFELLENSGLKHNEQLLALTWVNNTEQNTIFLQIKNTLKKFFRQQSKPIHSDMTQHSSIKLEYPEEQDVNVTFP